MIIKTKIDWLQNKKLTTEERELLEAKKEFENGYDSYDDEYEETEKNAIIDTGSDKLYIEIEPNKICLIKLLGGEYYTTDDGRMERIEERLYFKSTLNDVYENLINNNNK